MISNLLCRKLPFTVWKKIMSKLDNINGSVFEAWFESTLISNLTKERKVKKVLNNAKCHSRLIEDTNHEHEKQ